MLRNGMGIKSISSVFDLSRNTVRKYVRKFLDSGISIESLLQMDENRLQEIESWAIKYRDLFKLSFMLIGINFVDLCNLKEIRNGRIEYIREKTHKLYSIKVEPEIAELISCYKGKNQLLNYMDTYKGYRHFYNNTCKGLSYIKDKLNEKELHIYP